MKRRLGPGGAVIMAVVFFVLAGTVPASAATTGGSIPLGTPFLYGEYAAGSSSVIGETVDGAAAYGATPRSRPPWSAHRPHPKQRPEGSPWISAAARIQ